MWLKYVGFYRIRLNVIFYMFENWSRALIVWICRYLWLLVGWNVMFFDKLMSYCKRLMFIKYQLLILLICHLNFFQEQFLQHFQCFLPSHNEPLDRCRNKTHPFFLPLIFSRWSVSALPTTLLFSVWQLRVPAGEIDNQHHLQRI